jgi:glutaredoxin
MEPSVQVTIYHLPGCARSEAIRMLLERSNVACETINVLTRPSVMNGLPMSVNTPFPTVRIGSRTLLNATPHRVTAILSKLPSRSEAESPRQTPAS